MARTTGHGPLRTIVDGDLTIVYDEEALHRLARWIGRQTARARVARRTLRYLSRLPNINFWPS
jgi:hypothetical protein